MAEFVHRQMEEMIPELEQMQRVGIFTPNEVKVLVKKRRNFEYKLVQKQKQKKFFLSYAQFEICLLELITSRRKKINYVFKKKDIEYSIVDRIHRIFRACTIRWPHDLNLWLSHARFCVKWKKKVQLSKLNNRLVSLHGGDPYIWILAAKWEWEVCLSEENSRSLFLQALEIHKNNKKILIEYFRAELLFSEKMKRQLKILGSEIDKDDEQITKEKLLLSGEAGNIIYRNARSAFPDDFRLVIEFARVAANFIDTFGSSIYDGIVKDLRNHFSSEPFVRVTLAKLLLDVNTTGYTSTNKKLEQEFKDNQAYSEMEKAVEEFNTELMWDQYIQFAYQLACDEEMPESISQQRFDKFLSIVSKGKTDPSHYVLVMKLMMIRGLYTEAINFVGDAYKENGELCLLRLKAQCSADIEEPNFYYTLKYIQSTSIESQKSFWDQWMTWSIRNDDEELAKKIAVDLSDGYKEETTNKMRITYLQWLVLLHDAKYSFKMFLENFNSKCKSVDFHQELIVFYENCEISFNKLSQLYEKALHNHGNSHVHIWINYLRSARNHGKVTKCGSIYAEAIKALKPELVEQFITEYTSLYSSS